MVKFTVNQSERHIKEFRNRNFDFTIVEILPYDNIDDNLFLYPEKFNVNNLKMKKYI
jgi:hypothetical protein